MEGRSERSFSLLLSLLAKLGYQLTSASHLLLCPEFDSAVLHVGRQVYGKYGWRLTRQRTGKITTSYGVLRLPFPPTSVLLVPRTPSSPHVNGMASHKRPPYRTEFCGAFQAVPFGMSVAFRQRIPDPLSNVVTSLPPCFLGFLLFSPHHLALLRLLTSRKQIGRSEMDVSQAAVLLLTRTQAPIGPAYLADCAPIAHHPSPIAQRTGSEAESWFGGTYSPRSLDYSVL